MSKKKILLIGSNGFFGKNFYQKLKSKFDVKRANRKTNIFKLNFKKFDFIINCAAEVYQEKLMFKNNTSFVFKIIEKYLYDKSSAKIIHFGSSGEYGRYGRPTSERDLLKPTTSYEATKGATLLLQGLSKNFKIPSIIFRPYSIYGPMENASRLIPTIFRHFLFNENLKIYDGYHDFVYIDDVSNIILGICKKNWKNKFYGEIINIGSGVQHSNYKVLKICENVVNKKSHAKLKKGFQRIYDNNKWLANTSKMKKFNIKTKTNLEEGIKKYWKYVLENNPHEILSMKKTYFKKMF